MDDDRRQQVLVLCLRTPELDAPVVAWSFFDGSGGRARRPAGPGVAEDGPPYPSGIEALEDGWRLLQLAGPPGPPPGDEHRVGFLKHEYVFERLVPAST
ncbi:MAG: hypothetical protein AAGK32_05225 [Actinomycetota bacterium]